MTADRRRRRLIKGLPISPGIVLGRTRVFLPGDIRVAEVPIPVSRVRGEIAALESAVEETISEWRRLRDTAGKKIGGPVAMIFDAQLLIASDYDFLQRVKEEIARERRNAGHVYNKLVQGITAPLKKSKDPYMQHMAQDIEAVSNRVLSHLSGYLEETAVRFPSNTILVSRSFTPGEILNYSNRKAVGFVSGEGGRSSHMALIARSLMVPLVVLDNPLQLISNGSRLIIDGTNGMAIVNPSDADWSEYQKKRKRLGPAAVTRIKKLPTIPPCTADGVPIQIAANLELPGPVDEILSAQKFPIGLYRTEFLYVEDDCFPSEESQYQYYRGIAETFSESQVTLRTFDLGSDKMRAGGSTSKEENPALGWRGIRPMLEMSRIFKNQIRAILKASAHGRLRVMLPMISDVTEFDRAKKLIAQVMLEFRREKIPFDSSIPIGVMVEVPSAALTADQLARKVDFISIGTNDLTQYTMSADRNNARVAGLYNPLHPSVLNLIKLTVDAGIRHKIPVAICGEVAGDPLALPLFVGMGVSQLSMNPARIFDACRLVDKIDSKLVRLLVGSVMASGTVSQVVRKLESYRSALEMKKKRR